MTEPKPTYETAPIEQAPEYVTCTCGQAIGAYQQVGGHVLLRLGGVLLSSAHGVCTCGKDFHWASSDRTLERLIERRMALAERRQPIETT